jgi:hypothetical protein
MQNNNYLHRVTVLFYAQQVGGLGMMTVFVFFFGLCFFFKVLYPNFVVSSKILNESILPLIIILAGDPVANIRYSAAHALEILHHQMGIPFSFFSFF